MRKRNRFTRVYFKYITVVIIGLMIVLGVVLFTGTRGVSEEPESEKESTEAPESTAADTTDETTESTTPEDVPSPIEATVSALDAMDATALISQYYQAKVDDNLDQLNRIVDSDTDYKDAEVLQEAQFVDRYDNFNTYVMGGADDDSFIVYVKYDIYFGGITTGAAALNHFYVVRDENGNMVIYDRQLTAEQQKALKDTENTEAVRRLKDQVEQELADACEENPDLRYLMAMLNHTEIDEEPESEETEEATETEKPSEDSVDESADGSAENESAEEDSDSSPAESEASDESASGDGESGN